MFLPKRIRKIVALLRGQVSPLLAGLAVGLGFWFGLIPGFYGIHALLLVLLVLLNVPIGLFILCMGLGKAAALAGAPVLYHVGLFVVEKLPFLIDIVAKVPLAGATDFGRYAVTGGLLAGPVIGGLFGLMVGRIILIFRKTWLKLESNSEKFDQWQKKKWVRFLDWLLVGKRAKDAKSTLEAKTKLIRKGGLVLAIILLVICLGLSFAFKNSLVKDKISLKLSEANGATVDVGSLTLSPTTGAVGVTGLAIADSTNLQRDQVQIGELSAKANVYQLSLGKLVMDQVTVSGVAFDQQRSEPAQLVEKSQDQAEVTEAEAEKEVEEKTPQGWDVAKLEDYLAQGKKALEWLEKIKPWLPERTAQQDAVQETPQRYLDYLTQRMDSLPNARVLAKEILLGQVELPDEQFGTSTITLKNLSDAPAALKLPLELDIQSEAGPHLQAALHFDDPNQPGKLIASFTAFDLAKMQAGLKSDNDLIFQQGQASGTVEGYVTKSGVDLTIQAQLSDLLAQADQGLFGLDAQTTREILKVLDDLEVTLKIVGPLSGPSLAFDGDDLGEKLKAKLVEAGQEKAAEEINKVIEKNLPKETPDEIKDVLESDVVKKGLQDLFGN